ncbi:asparagine synthase [Paramagnetospirillum caucaseum]|uniref:asparagine synthase (glutamine-hydrolyzing) n=1 Tax=Paramagnetospirillum caucaseum TaxID=1244869 RepID=M3AFC7_9PROT|nr:asparagine synthase-related protein [Paramagnetospirillum caucaseum]EME71279.1 asparagine synthase [Paramagnetospirillum caucaseum]
MSFGVFGLVRRDGGPISAKTLEIFQADVSSYSGNIRADFLCAETAILGSIHRGEQGACPLGEAVLFSAAGRLDNRTDLALALDSVADGGADLSDRDLIRHAYGRWGADCVNHLRGDWCFAAWHPADRRLVLARDRFGPTALAYCITPAFIAFSPRFLTLRSFVKHPSDFDELYLAQRLVGWHPSPGDRTIHPEIKLLPPAHVMVVTPEQTRIERYWRIEDVSLCRFRQRQDYADRFRELFDAAVRNRLVGDGPFGATLSGGLDSSSVAVTAAAILSRSAQRLHAFTSIPTTETSPYTGPLFGNELPYARAAVEMAGNIDHHLVEGRSLTPLQGLRAMLSITGTPGYAVTNFFWRLELQAQARALGCQVVLTGHLGNPGISWVGSPFSLPLVQRLRRIGLGRCLKELLREIVPTPAMRMWKDLRLSEDWFRTSAIHPEFARRIRLRERILDDGGGPLSPRAKDGLTHRLKMLSPEANSSSAIYTEMGLQGGIEYRDPTADAGLLEYVLSIPDHIFIDQESGLDRWVIRSAMTGRLPDVIRVNSKIGRQAADLVPRLRGDAQAMDVALDELAHGPAANYVDVDHMRATWRSIQTEDGPDILRQADSIIMRGVMAGQFVNTYAADRA